MNVLENIRDCYLNYSDTIIFQLDFFNESNFNKFLLNIYLICPQIFKDIFELSVIYN